MSVEIVDLKDRGHDLIAECSRLPKTRPNVDLRESERPNVDLHRVDLIGSIENVRSSGPGVSIEIFVSIVERATLKARFDDGLLT